MLIVGLTGGIGSGKSTVAASFTRLGVPVIDMDLIAKQIVEPGNEAHNELRQEFGSQYFDDDGCLNRAKLAELVFTDAEKRRALNKITHPKIKKRFLTQIVSLFFEGHKYVVLDSPLLIESGTHKFVQKVLVVSCDRDAQLERTLRRNPEWTRDQVQNRIDSQISIDDKIKVADVIVDNQGDLTQLHEQIERIHAELRASHWEWIPLAFVIGIPALLCIATLMFIASRF